MNLKNTKTNFLIFNLLYVSAFLFLFNSCASTHNGVLNSSNDLRNVKYVDFAFGNSKTTTFLGIGGNKHDALVLEAKLNMMRNFPLKPNQFYGNFIVDYKTTKVLGVVTNLVTVSADILEEKTSIDKELFSESLKGKLGISKENEFFAIGDTVVDMNNVKYTVSSNYAETLVLYPIETSEKKFSEMQKIGIEIFSTKKTIQIEDENKKIIQFCPGNYFLDGGFKFKIVGVNKEFLLLENESATVYFTRPVLQTQKGKKVITFD
jgi:hypothetical protein